MEKPKGESPRGAPLKEQFSAEMTKLREMSLRGKVEHIWEYYKIPMIGIIILIFLIGGLLNMWIFNPRPETALFVAWNGGFALEEQFDGLRESLEKRLIDEHKNEEIIISQFMTGVDDPTMAMANVQRMIAMLSAGTIDLFILSTEMLEEQSNGGFLRPMESMLSEIKSMNPGIYARIEENITMVRYEIEEGDVSENIMGISIGSSPLLTELEFFEQELYLSIAITSDNTEIIKQALIAFFE